MLLTFGNNEGRAEGKGRNGLEAKKGCQEKRKTTQGDTKKTHGKYGNLSFKKVASLDLYIS